jgi:hypothetical protein
MTRVLPRSVGGPTQGGCSPPHATDPVNIPHDVENRRVATRFDQELNPQISGPSRVPPQVTESARLNLSRWRHGFEPRWDYKRNVPGQGTGLDEIGRSNSDSNARYPEIPSQIERSKS